MNDSIFVPLRIHLPLSSGAWKLKVDYGLTWSVLYLIKILIFFLCALGWLYDEYIKQMYMFYQLQLILTFSSVAFFSTPGQLIPTLHKFMNFVMIKCLKIVPVSYLLGYVTVDLWYKSGVFTSTWLPENKIDSENSYVLLLDRNLPYISYISFM